MKVVCSFYLKFIQTLINIIMRLTKLSFFLTFYIFLSCSSKPQPISYGQDVCHFCIMNIVDKQHAAQYVTKKGKQLKFDAIECMISDLTTNNNEDKIATLLVADFGTDGEMIDAISATYLICPEIKSPMGAYLSAFSTEDRAVETKTRLKGEIYSWITLKEKYADK